MRRRSLLWLVQRDCCTLHAQSLLRTECIRLHEHEERDRESESESEWLVLVRWLMELVSTTERESASESERTHALYGLAVLLTPPFAMCCECDGTAAAEAAAVVPVPRGDTLVGDDS